MDELLSILREIGVYKKGNFTLKSGAVSDRYLDIKSAYGFPEAMSMISEAVLEIIDQNSTCVAGSGAGGSPLAKDISTLSCRKPWKRSLGYVWVEDEQREHGIRKSEKGRIECYIPGKNDKVSILDDVITKGTSVKNTIEILKPTGAEILECCVVVNRSEGNPLGIPLKYLFKDSDFL